MPTLSNPRHERFAQELAKGKSQTEAYLAAGYDATEQTARRAASALMTNHDISARVAELQDRGAKRAEITLESLIAEAEQARELAMGIDQPAAAVGALTAKAKLAGLWVEKRETTNIKRDATDWTRAELVALVGDAGTGGTGTPASHGRNGKLN